MSGLILDKISRPGTSVSYPAQAGKFFISAVDKTGNESDTAETTTILNSELPALGTTLTLTQNPGFSGTPKTNVTVSGGNLFLTNASSLPNQGILNFDHGTHSDYVDVSPNLATSRTIRVSYAFTSTRRNLTSVNGEVDWDDIPNNWNSWPGDFNDWTDEQTNFGDYSVTVQTRASATISGLSNESWVEASGEVVGKYIEFRAVLSSTSENVTPNITALSATLEY